MRVWTLFLLVPSMHPGAIHPCCDGEQSRINSFFSKLLLLVLFHKAEKKVSSAFYATIVWPEVTGLPIEAGNAKTFGKWLVTVLIAFRFVYFLCYFGMLNVIVPFAFHLSNITQSLLTLTIHALSMDFDNMHSGRLLAPRTT